MIPKDQMAQMISTVRSTDNTGLTPKCQFCGAEDCYEIVIRKYEAEEYLIKNYFFDDGKYSYRGCYQWMVNAGGLVTKLLHVLLRLKLAIHLKHKT